MLQQEKPEDYVIATGIQHSVRHFVEMSARHIGVKLLWSDQGIDEIGTVAEVDHKLAPAVSVGDVLVQVDPRYFRPTEVETLLGDPSKAMRQLGWKPEIGIEQLVAEMMEADIDDARRHAILKEHGLAIPVRIEI